MSQVTLVALNIRSTHNVGSLFRTCDGFGANLVLIGITPRPISSKDERLPHIAKKADKDISKTALGAEKTVTWEYFKDFNSFVQKYRKLNSDIIAIEQNRDAKHIKTLKSNKNIALVVGPEVTGIPDHSLRLCDDIYEIPMHGLKESFNVSVAAGIALYQATL